jgi:S-adenosylmethionine synthetase
MPSMAGTTAPRLFTSESVTEGHPDKLADQISDAVLDELIADDPFARVACETLVTTGLVVVAGEITTATYVDIPATVRRTITDVGYTSSKIGFDGETCGVAVAIQEQSPDISVGVEHAYEERMGESADSLLDSQGAGDQGMMFGYACNESDDLMPLPIWLAHRSAQRLTEVRKAGVVPYLRPDGKVQVTIRYEGDRPVALDTIVISTQHQPNVDIETLLTPDLLQHVVDPLIPPGLDAEDVKVLVNPTGVFEIGGPRADTGLTGRKIVIDTYGGMARHGGGAFSGKDPTKVDRSAAYACRYVAKNVVAAGLADRFEFQVAYAIGVSNPISVSIDTFDTQNVAPERIEAAIEEVFDMRPAAIIRDLDLRRPIYRNTACYGHFGRSDKTFTWERTDRADDLRRLCS